MYIIYLIYVLLLLFTFCFFILAPQPPVPGSTINPTICAGITGLLVGIGIGIGFGALIFNPYRAGKVGGGIWFGKKRRKRGVIIDEDYDEVFEEQDKILETIEEAKDRYDEGYDELD